MLANPLGFVPGNRVRAIQTISAGVGVVDQHAQALQMTDTLERDWLDYCAALRSGHAQRRARLVEAAKAGATRLDVGPAAPARP